MKVFVICGCDTASLLAAQIIAKQNIGVEIIKNKEQEQQDPFANPPLVFRKCREITQEPILKSPSKDYHNSQPWKNRHKRK